ncbi:hypothetical protein Gogos_003709 [Gossypium gossypioides]|uniref:Uncharacterized protein n=1 Tax=Gossypium gossypioides TaxID=34282 RepID=A0A7J9CNP5_GOSGO|nr:hypothetical protein [Gossypium gossypioides]
MARDDISLLEEESVHLTVKSSLVVPNGKLTLLGIVWTMKTYNPDRFRAQLKKEEDLELILAGRLWLFRRNLMIFKKLEKPIDKSNLCLVKSPFLAQNRSLPT